MNPQSSCAVRPNTLSHIAVGSVDWIADTEVAGFEKVELAPGASAKVTFPLSARDRSVWYVSFFEFTNGLSGKPVFMCKPS